MAWRRVAAGAPHMRAHAHAQNMAEGLVCSSTPVLCRHESLVGLALVRSWAKHGGAAAQVTAAVGAGRPSYLNNTHNVIQSTSWHYVGRLCHHARRGHARHGGPRDTCWSCWVVQPPQKGVEDPTSWQGGGHCTCGMCQLLLLV